MSKSLKIAAAALALASSSAFAQYADHPVFRGQTPGSQPEASASAGASVSTARISPSMADFFRWNDLGALHGTGA
jgi:hypothetical protein